MPNGKPLDETTRGQMESFLGHDLKDIRVHDSRQAGKLAQRLGAEAFTVGRHIFGPAERLSASSTEGTGLLAHEATHVIQQTRPSPLPLAPVRVSRRGATATQETPKPPVQLADIGHGGTGTIQRAAEESAAEATEQRVMRTVQSGEAEGREGETPGQQVDIEKIANMVYRMMLRDMIVERERR